MIMYDRPTLEELLAAVAFFLHERVQPAVEGDAKLADETRISAEVIATAIRQLNAGSEPLRAAWKRLDYVMASPLPLPDDPFALGDGLLERERKLCEAINSGFYDTLPRRAALFEHLKLSAQSQLEVSNPAFLESLALEDQKRSE